MKITGRGAGLSLLAYGLATPLAFAAIGSPGGDYDDATVTAAMAPSHWVTAFALAYVGAFAALGLLVYAKRIRRRVGSAGGTLWGLTIAAATTGVVGWFLVGGVAVALAEGGQALTSLPHPVVYLVSEMSNLIAICATAFFVGAGAILIAAKAVLPRWLRVASFIAGVCGILAPLYFPLALFFAWAILMGAWLTAKPDGEPIQAAGDREAGDSAALSKSPAPTVP